MMDMKKNKIWLQTEYKRAAVMLPSILKRAVALAAVCLLAAGVTFFCAGALIDHGDREPKLKVGYTAEENQITALAVAYVQSMESIKSLCSLEAVTEQEGRRLLKDGELSALIVLPGDVINEILSGSNTPATLYLPENRDGASSGGLGAVGGILFEELASAGIGMLGTAQAEIYASGAILRELSAEYGQEAFEDGFLQSMYDEINRFNLQAAAGREKLFRKKTLSLTENDTYVIYYGSALFTIYVMLAGLFLGKFCKRSGLQQTMADRRVGVGYAAQLAARCLAGCALMFAVVLLPFLAVFLLGLVPPVGSVLTVRATWQGFVSLFFIIGFMTVYFMMIYQIAERRESALVVTGILAVLQAYLSGCLVPSVLLPKAVAAVGRLLPAAMVKKGFTILFTGDVQSFSYVAAGLCAWGVCLFWGTVLSMRIGGKNQTAGNMEVIASKVRVPSLAMVLLRRLLHRKSVWISLGVIVVLSAVIMEVEQSSQTQIKAAVCDESGDYVELLETYDGLVAFEWYESDEAVQDAVLRGDVECGYVLPRTLAEDMTAMRADGEILVYQDADAVAVPVVNEILFERIFRQVSLEWFEKYISQNSVINELGAGGERLQEIAEECFNRELLAGTTFRFEIRRIDNAVTRNGSSDVDEEKRIVYPVYVVAVVAVLLCALQGILQVVTDVREQHFYKRNRLAVSALTLILPLMLGVMCALLILMVHKI